MESARTTIDGLVFDEKELSRERKLKISTAVGWLLKP
jgi:hypothetical protein